MNSNNYSEVIFMRNIFKPIVASLATVLTLSSVCVTSVFADCTDSSWSTSTEKWRYKNGSTSVYVYNKGSNNASVSVYGENSNGGLAYGDVSTYYYSSGGYSYHSTVSLTVQAGQQATIRQFINELGYSYAHLCVGNVYGSTNGVWSPDSTRDYTVIN